MEIKKNSITKTISIALIMVLPAIILIYHLHRTNNEDNLKITLLLVILPLLYLLLSSLVAKAQNVKLWISELSKRPKTTLLTALVITSALLTSLLYFTIIELIVTNTPELETPKPIIFSTSSIIFFVLIALIVAIRVLFAHLLLIVIPHKSYLKCALWGYMLVCTILFIFDPLFLETGIASLLCFAALTIFFIYTKQSGLLKLYLSKLIIITLNITLIAIVCSTPKLALSEAIIFFCYAILVTSIISILIVQGCGINILSKIYNRKSTKNQMLNNSEFSKINLKESLKLNRKLGGIVVKYNQLVDYYENNCQDITKYERDATWREIAKQVAHEIRNPLTPMRLKIEMLQHYKGDNTEQYLKRVDSTLEILLEQITLLSNIADDFSDMSKIPSSSLQQINLDSLLSSVTELYREKSGMQVTLISDPSEKHLSNINYDAMLRVMINLLKNSYEATTQGECTVKIKIKNSEKEIIITLENNSPNIENEVLDRIFELNFTTKKGGSGVGLAICRGIIESFGGSISVQNLTPTGVAFTIKLPRIMPKN